MPLSAMSAASSGRRGFQRDLHGLDDLADRLGQGLGGLLLGDAHFARHALHQVAALDLDGQAVAVHAADGRCRSPS